MKKKLYRSMCIVACGTILLTAVVSLLIFYGLIETQIKETIRNECYLVAAGLNDTADEKAYFDELAKPLPETGRLSRNRGGRYRFIRFGCGQLQYGEPRRP